MAALLGTAGLGRFPTIVWPTSSIILMGPGESNLWMWTSPHLQPFQLLVSSQHATVRHTSPDRSRVEPSVRQCGGMAGEDIWDSNSPVPKPCASRLSFSRICPHWLGLAAMQLDWSVCHLDRGWYRDGSNAGTITGRPHPLVRRVGGGSLRAL